MADDFLDEYIGQLVVCDLRESYLAIGILRGYSSEHLRLEGVDLHDHNEANSTKDIYLIETKRYGVRQNRAKLDIPRRLMIAICRLDDVVE